MSWAALQRSHPPDLGVAIDRGYVACARLGTAGQPPAIDAHAWQTLPLEAVVPALATPNLPDVPAVAEALRRVIAQVGGRPRRVALILPDASVKVSLVRLESVPARPTDLHDMLRWQVRKSAPFPIEQARVSFTEGQQGADGSREFVVVLARDEVIGQYEQACALAGLQPGVVDVASLNVVNAALAQMPPEGDWLLVSIAPSSTTLTVVRDGRLIFFRSRGDSHDESLADVIHQTAMYYEDRLQGRGFSRMLVCGLSSAPDEAAGALRALAERLKVSVSVLNAASVSPFGAASPPASVADALLPVAGVLLRERRAA